MNEEIKLEIDPDYCQGNATEYEFQSPPEELRSRPIIKLRSIKVGREKK